MDVEVGNWKLGKQNNRNDTAYTRLNETRHVLMFPEDTILMSYVIVDPRHLFMYAVSFTLLELGIYYFYRTIPS